MSTPGVAAFDFDGTLTRADTMIGFLRRVAGTGRVAAAVAGAYRVIPQARRRDPVWRDVVKAAVLHRLLAGRPESEIAAAGETYGTAVATQVTPAMRSVLERHHGSGHRTVIVSASLEVYVVPAARRLGVDAALATRLEVGPDGRLTGRLEGANCRGAEKARRLADWMAAEGIDPDRTGLWAYGNSSGDREMLALAAVATRVRRGRPPAVPAP